MKKQKSKDEFWLVFGILNILAMVYPVSAYLQADSNEDRILAVCVLLGLGMLLAIVDTVTVVVAYSE